MKYKLVAVAVKYKLVLGPGSRGRGRETQKPELCYICEQEMLQSNFFSKNKHFRNALLEYNTGLGYFILTT